MISFFLFETHGRVLFLEALLPKEAAAIFRRLGATDDDLKTQASRKAFFKKEMRKYHPDVIANKGDKAKEETFKNLSSANDTLKAVPDNFNFDGDIRSGRGFDPGFTDFTKKQEPEDTDTSWQTDSRSSYNSINRNDFTDINFFKKKMWELSGKSRRKYTIMAYDGAFFRGQITVFGSDAIFEDMAKAMIVWNTYGGNPYQTQAVFVMKDTEPHKLYLIYLKPHFLAKHPFVFDEEDFEGMPYNDTRFQRVLPDRLREISTELNESISESMIGHNGPPKEIPKGLAGLAAEAKKSPSFEDFRKDFLLQIKHGTYWHVTENPNFQIDPNLGPRDMSSMADGKMDVGKLMVSSHLDNWTEHYGKHRQYAALIDMSGVPRKDYYQVNRGFGNEFFVTDPSKAKVVKVVPIKTAKRIDRQRHALLPQSDEELRKFYEQVTGRLK